MLTSKPTNLVAACFAVASLAACAGEPSSKSNDGSSNDGVAMAKSAIARDTSPSVSPADAAALRDGNTAFAVAMYETMRQDTARANLFFSPHSISTALAMTYAGARGATEKEMAAAMHYTLPQDRLHPALDALDLALESRGNGEKAADGKAFRLRTTNSLWGAPQTSFEAPFLDTLAKSYGAGIRLTDFAKDPEAARGTINRWVEGETEGRIEDLLSKGSIDDSTRFVLVNAIYFNAAWSSPFEERATNKAAFHGAAGDVQADMMHAQGAFRYTKAQGYQAVAIPYAGNELSFVAVLPDDLATFEASLTPEVVRGLATSTTAPVDLGLPKFQIDGASVSLKKALEAQGMKSAFDGAAADFSGISTKDRLFISDVVHQAFVKVDEKGTEAAAATAVIGVGGSAVNPDVVHLTFDRPFVFFVRDEATGAILFLGRVQSL